jgi:hypothetical protein
MMDVKMESVANSDKESELELVFLSDIKKNINLLERAVNEFEKRLTLRVLRTNASIRKRMNEKLLKKTLELMKGNEL